MNKSSSVQRQPKLGSKRAHPESQCADDSWKTWFEDARSAFAEARYNDANDLFTKALELNPKQITLLDCRAATREKLEKYPLALQDGAAMIKIAPTQSKGYLRSGKLLTLQRRFNAAAKIYERGLKNVDRSDARYTLLSQMSKAAEASVKKRPRTAIKDPMMVLPRDLLTAIFCQLSFERRVECMAVSRIWRDFALSWPEMWRNLDFGLKQVSNYTLKQYLSYATGRGVQSLSFSGNKAKMKTILQLLINENCYYIKNLGESARNALGQHSDFVAFYESEIPEGLLIRMLRLVGKHVVELKLDSCVFADYCSTSRLDLVFGSLLTEYTPQLTSFYVKDLSREGRPLLPNWDQLPQTPLDNITALGIICNLNFEETEYVLGRCRRLQRLGIGVGRRLSIDARLLQRYCPHLRSLWLVPVEAEWTWQSPASLDDEPEPGLQEFVAEQVRYLNDADLLAMVGGHCQTLRVLNINNCVCVRGSLITHLAIQGAPLLHTFCVARCSYATEHDLLAILAESPLLKVIDVSSVTAVTNKVVEAMCRLQHLTTVNLSSCCNVTGASIRELVDTHKHLTSLVMNDCTNISADAVQYAVEHLGRRVVECRYSRR